MTVIVKSLGLIPIEMIKIKDRYRKDTGDIKLMAASLEARGQIQPIVIDEKMNLLAGERRILAAKTLGWKQIRAEQREGPAKDRLEVEHDENVVRKDFTWVEAAKLEKAIFDNQKKTDPKWTQRDQAELRDSSVGTVNRKIQLAEGMELLPELEEFETEDDAFKYFKRLEEEAAIKILKDKTPEHIKEAPKWASDHYRVEDALKALPKVKAKTCDFAEVDPPYGIDLVNRKDRLEDKTKADTYNEIDEDEFPAFMKHVIKHTYRILKDDTFAVFWFGMQWYTEMNQWLAEAGFKVNPLNAIWYKGQSGQTASPDVALASVYEPFLLARKGQPKMKRAGRANVFHYSALASSKKIHLTEKPQDLLRDILDTFLFPGSEIIVPFLGSGATLRAAYSLGHSGFGFDLSETHKERFLRKVGEEFNGEKAEAETADGLEELGDEGEDDE